MPTRTEILTSARDALTPIAKVSVDRDSSVGSLETPYILLDLPRHTVTRDTDNTFAHRVTLKVVVVDDALFTRETLITQIITAILAMPIDATLDNIDSETSVSGDTILYGSSLDYTVGFHTTEDLVTVSP